jgi:hypothetical protein
MNEGNAIARRTDCHRATPKAFHPPAQRLMRGTSIYLGCAAPQMIYPARGFIENATTSIV